jgi:phage terminase small subunit
MPTLTEKQQQFVVNKAAGVKNKDAAVAAGYAASSAAVTAAQLMSRSDIKAAIAKTRKEIKSGTQELPFGVDELDAEDKKSKMPKASYSDPMDFLSDVMNHKHLPIAMRADAAFKLMPYKHARIGEAGKKEKAKERAIEISRGGGKNKFATKAPPSLRAITGGKP